MRKGETIGRIAALGAHGMSFSLSSLRFTLFSISGVQVRAGRDLSDTALRDMVTARLGRTNGASFADIAATADSVGRPLLATMLLDFEPRIADQVCRGV